MSGPEDYPNQTLQPEQPRPPGPPRSAVATALLNLTGLALGYAYLRAWWRFALYLTGAIGLVTIAFASRAADTPWAWQAITAIWLVWTAIDGWRLARRGLRPDGGTVAGGADGAGERSARRQLVPAGVGVVLVGAVVAGYVVYLAAGDRAYATGVAAQARADCPAATTEFRLVSDLYELTLSPNVRAAEVRTAQCVEFETAGAERQAGSFGAAVERYRNVRQTYPGTELVPFVTTELHGTFADWGRSLRTAGDFTEAIRVYRDALTEPGAPAGTRSELAATYLERAADTRAGAPSVASVQATVEDVLVVAREFADTSSAAQVPQALTDTYTAAIVPVAELRFCDAVPVLDYLVGLPGPEAGGIVATAHGDRARSLYECGLATYRGGDPVTSVDRLEVLVGEYPNDLGVPQARSAIVAATISQAKNAPLPPLPAPLAGDSPGSIPYEFYNDSPHEVRVLVNGPTTHEVFIPGCPQCPPSYPDQASGCPDRAGRPSVTLRLRPGVYDDLIYAASQPGITPHVDMTTLEPGVIYSSCYFVAG